MAVNKGYLTAKTDKYSDEYYTPREAVLPIVKYIDKGNKITTNRGWVIHSFKIGMIMTGKFLIMQGILDKGLIVLLI